MQDKMISEQRLTQRLTTYWERLRKEAHLPEITKFNSNAVAEIWDFCFRVSVDIHEKGKRSYVYEYMGREIVQAFGKDLTGQQVTGISQNVPGVSILGKIDMCVDQKQPIFEDGKFINEKNKVVKYRSCMIPFTTKKEEVSHVVVGLSWRAF